MPIYPGEADSLFIGSYLIFPLPNNISHTLCTWKPSSCIEPTIPAHQLTFFLWPKTAEGCIQKALSLRTAANGCWWCRWWCSGWMAMDTWGYMNYQHRGCQFSNQIRWWVWHFHDIFASVGTENVCQNVRKFKLYLLFCAKPCHQRRTRPVPAPSPAPA